MHFNNAAALETLSQLFLQSLSPDRDPAAAHGFGLAFLNVISADPFDEKIHLAAAVHFKNHLRSRWTLSTSSSSDAPPPTPPIPDAEKNQIKALIVSLMLKVPRRIRPQLSEALSIVSPHEFPLAWASLLPQLVSNVRSAADYSTASSAAPTPSSSSSAAPSTPPPSASTALPSSLPEIFVKTAQLISANATASSPDVLCHPFFESQHLCCETFDSLNSIELL